MNTHFEIRFFRIDGYCFAVQEYAKAADPHKIFAEKVEAAKELIAKARAEDLNDAAIHAFVPMQMQLVERDDHMTWLVEHNNWAAA